MIICRAATRKAKVAAVLKNLEANWPGSIVGGEARIDDKPAASKTRGSSAEFRSCPEGRQ